MASHEPAAVRRAQILEAALHCFGEKGLHAARMDDIAHASGLSKGAIYFHFESKDEIFRALFHAFEEALFTDWDALPRGSALETLRAIGQIALEKLLQLRPLLAAWTEFLRQPESRAHMAEVYRQSRARIAATVRAGIDSGELRETSPEHVAAVLTALIEGLLLQAFVDPDYDPLPAWPTAWEVVGRGLAA